MEVQIPKSSQTSPRNKKAIDKSIHKKGTFHWMWGSPTLTLAKDVYIVLPPSPIHPQRICPGHWLRACLLISTLITGTKLANITVPERLNEAKVSSWGGAFPTVFLNGWGGTVSIWDRILSIPDNYPRNPSVIF